MSRLHILNVDVSKTLRSGANTQRAIFVDIDICRRRKQLQTLFFVKLTYFPRSNVSYVTIYCTVRKTKLLSLFFLIFNSFQVTNCFTIQFDNANISMNTNFKFTASSIIVFFFLFCNAYSSSLTCC